MLIEKLVEVKRSFSMFLSDICLRKKDFYRELNPMDRIYDVFHTTLFCFVAQNGTNIFFLIPTVIEDKGLYFIVHLLVYGLIALLSGICYAEMAELMPSTGAAYHYCYYSMGEFIAFLAGWNMIYCTVLTTYSKCSLIRFMLDDGLFNYWIEKNVQVLPEYDILNIFYFGGTVDIAYPVLILTVTALSTAFVKKGKYVCSALALTLIATMVFYMILLIFYVDKENICARKREHFSYAASSFVQAAYVYSGYEVISILGEEAINPTDTIPRSILNSMKCTIFVSVIWSAEVALAWAGLSFDPYWPFRALLESCNLSGLEWISFFGMIAGAWSSIFASFFLLIRLMYAMSRDGLIFNVFSKIDRTTTAPFVPALIVAVCLIILEIFVKQTGRVLHSIFISLMATKIGMYICLLNTRYEYKTDYLYTEYDYGDRWVLINWPRSQYKPTPVTHRLSMILILIITLASYILVQSMMTMRIHNISNPWVKAMAILSLIILILAFGFLSRQPQNDRSNLQNRVPDVPFIPVVAMVSDFIVCLNETMRPLLWMPLILWWLVGIIYYFVFSRKNSAERRLLNPDGTKWEIMSKDLDSFGNVDRQDSIVIYRQEVKRESEESIITEESLTSDIEDNAEDGFESDVLHERSSSVNKNDEYDRRPSDKNGSSGTTEVDFTQENQIDSEQADLATEDEQRKELKE